MTQEVDRLHLILVQNAPDAIIYADAKGGIFFWNAGAERIFGFSPREGIGQSLDIYYSRESPETSLARI